MWDGISINSLLNKRERVGKTSTIRAEFVGGKMYRNASLIFNIIIKEDSSRLYESVTVELWLR